MKKKFTKCPHCGFTEGDLERVAIKFGGAKFGDFITGLAAIVTGVRVVDIRGNGRTPQLSHVRAAIIVAMKTIAAEHEQSPNWANCSAAIGRDKGNTHRLYNTWRDSPIVLKHSAQIVERYRAR